MVTPDDEPTTCSVCGEDVGVVRPPYGKYKVIAIACTRKKCIDEIIEKNAWTPLGGIHYTSFYTTVFVPLIDNVLQNPQTE